MAQQIHREFEALSLAGAAFVVHSFMERCWQFGLHEAISGITNSIVFKWRCTESIDMGVRDAYTKQNSGGSYHCEQGFDTIKYGHACRLLRRRNPKAFP